MTARKNPKLLIYYFIFFMIDFFKNLRILLPLASPKLCRHIPTCSEYSREAIKKYGFKGALMGIYRVMRCHPFSKNIYDPVP